ncbi:hypothetical protein LXL04_020539 [Taraxacum kok-saghyz]
MILIELSAIEQKINLYEQVTMVTNVPESESSKTKAIPVQQHLELKPDYKKALDKEAERYYVIYKGPHAGIHTDWGTTETFCKVDKVTCRKFGTEASVRLSIALYEEASKTKRPLLRPKIQTAKEDHREQ